MISATSSMTPSDDRSEVLHQLVQRIGQRRLHVRREMGVDLGRAQALVTEDHLDQSQTHAGGVEVRRVRMAQRILTLPMNRPPPSFTTVTIRFTANP